MEPHAQNALLPYKFSCVKPTAATSKEQRHRPHICSSSVKPCALLTTQALLQYRVLLMQKLQLSFFTIRCQLLLLYIRLQFLQSMCVVIGQMHASCPKRQYTSVDFGQHRTSPEKLQWFAAVVLVHLISKCEIDRLIKRNKSNSNQMSVWVQGFESSSA